MLDGLHKTHMDRFWEVIARPLAKAGLTPNQVTALGLLLVLLSCLWMLVHESYAVFALMLWLALAFDSLDGAVARLRDMCTSVGGYFDAIVDRYQELAVLATLSYCVDAWALGLAAFSGSVLTSYAKARCAIECPIDNNNWPDLFERTERIIYLVVMLFVAHWWGDEAVVWGLLGFSLLAHATALQRALRAVAFLKAQRIDA